MKLTTPKQMKMLEEITFNNYSTPSVLLMENAANAFFGVLRTEENIGCKSCVTVFCGKGGNGGDGFAISRFLKNAGADVTVFLTCDECEITGDAKINFEIIKKMGINITDELSSLTPCDIIVDAIFGIGFKGSIKGNIFDVISYINDSRAKVYSVDIPSGANAEDGSIGTICVMADVVVTFGLPKVGLYLFPAKEYAKKVITVPISIPKTIVDEFNADYYLLDENILNYLPVRAQNSHKGTFGRVLCVCGSTGYTGACYLSATAAQKSGAGLVTAAVPNNILDVMATKFTEVMTFGLSDDITVSSDKILNFSKNSLVIGCGIGRSDDALSLARNIIKACDVPFVVDADAIFALSQDINILKEKKAPAIITPHIAEFARLLGIDTSELLENRIEIARKFAKEFDTVLILKSADTLIVLPSGKIYICQKSNSGLAKGGSGDTLAGICASLLAQGIDAKVCAPLATYIHSEAAFYAKEALGEYFMTASDIIKYLPAVIDNKKI